MKPRKPLKRSTKPIKRSPIKRKARRKKSTDNPEHLAKVRGLPCIVCEDLGLRQGSRTSAHHIKDGYGTMKAPDLETIPLCEGMHHNGGQLGMAVHAGRDTWEENFGSQREMLARTLERLGVAQ